MNKHSGKVVIKSLQGSAVTQTVLDGQTIHPPVANFLQCICVKNYDNYLAVDKVIAKISRLTFFGPPCVYYKRPLISRYLRSDAALSEKLPILAAPLRFGASCAVNPLEISYKPLLFRNYGLLATFLSLTVHSVTHCQLWKSQHTYVKRAVLSASAL